MSKAKKAQAPVIGSDLRDFDVVEIATGTAAGAVYRREYHDCLPIDRYHRQKMISNRQWAAGVRLAQTHHAAGLDPRTTANLLSAGGGDCHYGMAATEKQADARKSLRMAIEAVPARLRPWVLGVCLEGSVASKIDTGRGLAKRAAELVAFDRLHVGLDALADHYGIPDA
jgi:hypothetical protein